MAHQQRKRPHKDFRSTKIYPAPKAKYNPQLVFPPRGAREGRWREETLEMKLYILYTIFFGKHCSKTKIYIWLKD